MSLINITRQYHAIPQKSKVRNGLGHKKYSTKPRFKKALSEARASSAAEEKARKLISTAKLALVGVAGVFGTAQALDVSHRHNNIKRGASFDKIEAKQKDRMEKQRIYNNSRYEEEMEEAYNRGLFLDYKNSNSQNAYKPLGYQPGLPGDPNINLVQNLYGNRTNHTRM